MGNHVQAKIGSARPVDATRELPVPAAEIDHRPHVVAAEEVLHETDVASGHERQRARARAAVPFVVTINALEDVGHANPFP